MKARHHGEGRFETPRALLVPIPPPSSLTLGPFSPISYREFDDFFLNKSGLGMGQVAGWEHSGALHGVKVEVVGASLKENWGGVSKG